MKSLVHIALFLAGIGAMLAVNGMYTVEAAPSTYCFFGNTEIPHCGLSHEDCNDLKKQASKDQNASCVKQQTK